YEQPCHAVLDNVHLAACSRTDDGLTHCHGLENHRDSVVGVRGVQRNDHKPRSRIKLAQIDRGYSSHRYIVARHVRELADSRALRETRAVDAYMVGGDMAPELGATQRLKKRRVVAHFSARAADHVHVAFARAPKQLIDEMSNQIQFLRRNPEML